MLTPEVIDATKTLISDELVSRKQLPRPGNMILGHCKDGLVLIFPALDVEGRKRVNVVAMDEARLRDICSEPLIRYFEDNRAISKQTIQEYALSFSSGWNDQAGKSN